MREEIDEIMTLKKIDIFDYDEVCNQYLREDMDEYGRKITKRYLSFCKSLDNLKLSCGANPNENFVLSGTAQTFNLTFDLAWKV